MAFLFFESGDKIDVNNFYGKVTNICEECLNEKFKCHLCGMFITKKWLCIHIEREHHGSESSSDVLEKPSSLADNNRTLIVGPRIVG